MVEGGPLEEALSPHLREAVGSMTGWRRLEEFLAAGSRTATEFQAACDSLTAEARATWEYLGEAPSGPLSSPAEEVGGRREGQGGFGGSRTLVVKQREGMRNRLLKKALSSHADRAARPVTVFPNVADDKCAGNWLLATPSPDSSMSAKVFREALSPHTFAFLPRI